MKIEVVCHTPAAEAFANVRANSAACKEWVSQLPASEGHAVIVANGPSLVDFIPQIKKRIELGQTVFALNGACQLLNQHGIIPDYQVVLDAHPDMLLEMGTAKRHLIASQCHPEVLAAATNPLLWHFSMAGIQDHIPEHEHEYSLIGGGLTVGLCTPCLAFTLGFRKLHLFAYDSSHRDGKSHAHLAPGVATFPSQFCAQVTLDGRTFETTLVMARQAQMFPELCNNLIDAGCIVTVDADPGSLILAVMNHARAQVAA
jgi:uncharacterized Rossmann fold enzyme